MKKDDKKLTVTEKVANGADNWIRRHYILLISLGVAFLVAIGIVIAVFVYLDVRKDNLFNEYDSVKTQYESLLELDKEDSEYSEAESAFLESAIKLASKSGNSYPVTRANITLGDYYFDLGDYSEAYNYYKKAIDKQPNTYLAQLAKMNQAAIYEYQNNVNGALEIYNSLWDDYGINGLYGSRALFNSARLYEKMGDTELALATYEQLVGEYGEDNGEYARIAVTRIAQLSDESGSYEFEKGKEIETPEDFTIERTIGSIVPITITAGPRNATITYPQSISLDDAEAALTLLDETYPGRYTDLNVYWTDDGEATLEYPVMTEAELNAEIDQIAKDLDSYISSLN